MSRENLLIVGCTSKIAREFIEAMTARYEIYGTYHVESPKNISTKNSYKLDLSDNQSILNFIESVKPVAFSGVLFFASTYNEDPLNAKEYVKMFARDLQINSFSQLTVAKFLTYAPDAKVFLFGDSGLQQPKKNFSSYSLSKAVLHSLVSIIAIELAERAKVLCFALGPTKPSASEMRKSEYFAQNAVQVDNPTSGLISYITFLLQQDNLSMTGIEIPYDGGAYLIR